MYKKIVNLLEWILIVCLIFDTNSVFNWIFGKKYYFSETILICLVILNIFKIFSGERKKITVNIKTTFIIFIFLSIISVEILINYSFETAISFIFGIVFKLLLFIMYIFFQMKEKRIDSLLRKYCTIINIIAIVSLIFYLFVVVFPILTPSGEINFLWGTNVINQERYINNYYNMFFQTQNTRNTAIFCEAPMFALHLTFALAILLFSNRKFKKICIIILLLAIITSTSTSAYIVSLTLIVLRNMYNEKLNKSALRLLIIFCFILIIGIVIFNIISIKKQTNSYNLRIKDYTEGINLWLDKPLVGYGYLYYNSGSNSIIQILVDGGIGFGIIFLLSTIFTIILSLKRRDYLILGLSITYLLNLILVIFTYTSLSILILSIEYIYIIEKKVIIFKGDKDEI